MKRALALAGAVALLLQLAAAPPPARAGAAAGPGGSARLGAEVAATLDSLPDGGTTTVLVTLRERARLVVPPGVGRKARLQAVITQLHTTADRSQQPVRAQLHTWALQRKVARSTPLWLVNAISVTATADVIRALAARPDVAEVSTDEIGVVPTAQQAEPNQAAIGAPEVWSLGDAGQNVVVASLDSGVDASHPDLAGRWRGGTNSWYDPYGQHPTAPADLTGHGTATMGVLVGGDAGGTLIGTAPGATWIAAKIFDDSGRVTATAVHQAFQWVLDPDGNPNTADAAQVVNGSWSIGAGPGCDLTFQPDLQALRAAGIVPVFAAGNFGSGSSSSVSPANYPEALSVGALNANGTINSASSRGPSGCGGRARPFPDVVAPGVDVRTTDRYGLYQVVSGTSSAAPHAAGALALLLSAYPGLDADRQQAALTGTATDLGPAGPDDTYGSGRIDVAGAYRSLLPGPDFGVLVTAGQASVLAGGSATYSVQVTAQHGFAADVGLALSGLGASQAAWTFAPPTVAAGSGTATLTISTAPSLPAGVYPLTVTGSSASLSRAVSSTLVIAAPPPPPPPPPDALYYSTRGNVNPVGVSGSPDDADIYRWDGTTHSRDLDASLLGLPADAQIDGYDRVDATHLYLSFANDSTRIPGLGTVQDEDVVYYAAGVWSVFFDGTAHGLTAAAADLDAINIVGSTLHFSTVGSRNPPGVTGSPDDADIYTWDGTSFRRVWDASANGLRSSANVDGLVWLDAAHFYLSFGPPVTVVPGIGSVDDEDVVRLDSGTWSVYFDGTAHGLAGAGADIDAFDIG